MSTFQPPAFRDFGAPILVLWQAGQYVASATPVSVHGDPGVTYASAGAGVESFDLNIDGLGVVPIPSAGTELSAADWVLTINTVYFAAHGVNPAFVDFTGTLALEAATSIAVSNYLDTGVGPGDAAFGVIGLPVVARSAISSVYQADRIPTVQGVSRPITVPQGANVVAVELLVSAVANEPASITWALCLSDPTDADPFVGIGKIVGLPFTDGAFLPAGGAFAAYSARAVLDDLLRSPEVPSTFFASAPRLRFEFRLPYGSQIRLFIAATAQGIAGPLPQANPQVEATVTFSAR